MHTPRRLLVATLFGLLLPIVAGGCGADYPPPLLANTAPPTIRVQLGRQRARAHLRIPGQSWEIRSLEGGSYTVRGASDLSTTLAAGARGIVVRGRDTGAAVLRVHASGFLHVDKRTYRGDLIVHKRGAKLLLVNELDLETYVAGVIGNEVGPGAVAATYRAQAVTARTYAYIRLQRGGASTKDFHVFDDQRSQVYTGMVTPPEYGIAYADMLRHTRDTRGVILTWRGRPFPTYYASTCGGHTTDAATSGLDPGHAAAVLQGVPCSHCTTSKYFEWQKTIGEADLVAALKRAKLPVTPPIRSIAITKRGRGGWVSEVTIRAGPKNKARVVPGTVFRTAARLRSHNIKSITAIRAGWVARGRGWGHGVGLCQVGAIEMGRKGATETEILRYYYPGVVFTKVY
jgi:stage II sporulation protein D